MRWPSAKLLLALAVTMLGIGLPRHVHLITAHAPVAADCSTNHCHTAPATDPAETPAHEHEADDCPTCQMLAGAVTTVLSSPEVCGLVVEIAIDGPLFDQWVCEGRHLSTLGARGPPVTS